MPSPFATRHRFLLAGLVAVALIAALVVWKLDRATVDADFDAPLHTGDPAPRSAWKSPEATPLAPLATAPTDPKAPANLQLPPDKRKKVLTQEEIDSGKW
jgi:hypothetical protein